MDLMPTILEAVNQNKLFSNNVSIPQELDGRSLWPTILNQDEGTHTKIYLSECAWQAARGIRTERYKYIRTLDRGVFSRPPRELFDLHTDPDETINLVDVYPELANKFEKDLDSWVERMLQGREDPMEKKLKVEGLPFRKRIEKILANVNLTWEEWIKTHYERDWSSGYTLNQLNTSLKKIT
jgi:arylsulfatase